MQQHDVTRLRGASGPMGNDTSSHLGADAPRSVTCYQAKAVALRILGEPSLAGSVFLMGGLVPWVVSGRDSGRLHGDVDFSVRAEDMPAVRAWLAGRGDCVEVLDSLDLMCNSDRVDYGLCAVIEGVPVSFCPFSLTGGALCQRSAAFAALEGFDALFEAQADDVSEEDFIERRTCSGGLMAGMATLEACRAAKEASGREKDSLDIAELDRLGCDCGRLSRMTAAFERMDVICAGHST